MQRLPPTWAERDATVVAPDLLYRLVRLGPHLARVTEVEAQLERALDEVDSAYRQIGNLTTELDAVHATVSWRLTGVLRAVRRRTRGSSAP